MKTTTRKIIAEDLTRWLIVESGENVIKNIAHIHRRKENFKCRQGYTEDCRKSHADIVSMRVGGILLKK